LVYAFIKHEEIENVQKNTDSQPGRNRMQNNEHLQRDGDKISGCLFGSGQNSPKLFIPDMVFLLKMLILPPDVKRKESFLSGRPQR